MEDKEEEKREGDERHVEKREEAREKTGEGNDNPLQYSCLDRGAWQATVYGDRELDMM